MKRIWMVAILGGLAFALARSPLGLRIGNGLRALSDRAMLATLQLTSEFESEA